MNLHEICAHLLGDRRALELSKYREDPGKWQIPVRNAEAGAAREQDCCCLIRQGCLERPEEARLADPGLATDEHDVALVGATGADGHVQCRELPPSPDEYGTHLSGGHPMPTNAVIPTSPHARPRSPVAGAGVAGHQSRISDRFGSCLLCDLAPAATGD